MVAEHELDVVEGVVRGLGQRIADLRAALFLISRNGGNSSAEIASRALGADNRAAGAPAEVEPARLDERVACIRCQLRERAPGSLWCRWCAPARNSAGRD